MPIRVVDDLKSAIALSGIFGASAAATAPGILPALPPEARELPLPLPLFCAVLAAQLTVFYGLLAWAGIRLARARGREPSSLLTRLWTTPSAGRGRERLVPAFGVGLCCGLLLVGAVTAIQQLFPQTLPPTLHPPGIDVALLASLAGSFGEEILFRLFLLSLLVRLLPSNRAGVAASVTVSALAFGAAHAPAFVFLFGGWREVPSMAWVWLIALNGICGVTYGIVFLRWGILSAIAAHLGTDIVWHAASQSFGGVR